MGIGGWGLGVVRVRPCSSVSARVRPCWGLRIRTLGVWWLCCGARNRKRCAARGGLLALVAVGALPWFRKSGGAVVQGNGWRCTIGIFATILTIRKVHGR